MKIRILAGTALLALSQWIHAAEVICTDPSINHMIIEDLEVSACLASGIGNINGNPANDSFLLGAGSGLTLVSKTDSANPFNIQINQTSQTGDSSDGTWSVDASLWTTYADAQLGFKLGTGNQPDEWFVYELVAGVTSGTWQFVNAFGTGGGYSHANLYSTETPFVPDPIPVPAAAWLFGSALLGLAGIKRRKA